MSATQDTTLSAAYTSVVDIHEAMDIADGEFIIASIGCYRPSVLVDSAERAVDAEVLDETAC